MPTHYKSFFTIILCALLLQSCYSIPEIEGFDESSWLSKIEGCETKKLHLAKLLVEQESMLLSEGEAEIKGLLGAPDEHELYSRNQKFFYYNLTTDDCNPAQRLSIRFDALDRVKEVMIIVK